MTKKEKEILDRFKRSIPKLSESEKDRLLIMGETIAIIADKSSNQSDPEDPEKKGA